MILKHKVALVTGSTSGIGLAIARRFVAEGAQVLLTDIDEEAGRAAAASLGCDFHILDVGDEAHWDDLARAHPACDVLVNNAGITQDNLAMRMKDEEWDSVISTNLTAVGRLSRLVLRGMMKAKHGPRQTQCVTIQ